MDKRKLTLAFFTLGAIFIFGCWVYLLNASVAKEFKYTYASFGTGTPAMTTLLFSALPFWKYILILVGSVSFIPVIVCNGKLQYLGMLFPISLSLLALVALYFPIFIHGAVI